RPRPPRQRRGLLPLLALRRRRVAVRVPVPLPVPAPVTAHRLSSAEAARRSHSILSAIRSAITVWYAVLGGIGAWTIHLMVLVSLVRYTCNAPGSEGWMHLTTAVTLAMTAVA